MSPEGLNPNPSPNPRRVFLAHAAAGAAGVVAWQATPARSEASIGAPTAAVAAPRRTFMLDEVTVSDFAPHVGGLFDVDAGPLGRVSLELSEASALSGGPAPGRSEPFALLFRGPASPALGQGVYTLTHAELGSLTIFMVPIGPGRDGKGPRYEAIFN